MLTTDDASLSEYIGIPQFSSFVKVPCLIIDGFATREDFEPPCGLLAEELNRPTDLELLLLAELPVEL